MSSGFHDDAISLATNSLRTDILQRLRRALVAEENWGNIEASRVTSRVLASISENDSEVVQTACAIEAIEKEDYASWPSPWLISGLRPNLYVDLSRWCSKSDPMSFQKARYQELSEKQLRCITYGFTPKLLVSNRQAFVDELVYAGRRMSCRGDEASAIDEENVVHIALSYKHADHFSKGGTIDYDTAEEAYYVICKVLRISGWVRIWIDQNLHRYSYDAPWFAMSLVPFATMTVVSAFGKHGDFALCCCSPFLWVETGLSLSALGIHCRPDICSTIEEVIVYPQSSLVNRFTFEDTGTIIGMGMSVLDSISQILRSVSWWTPDLLSHNDYSYIREFKGFVQWAKAQVARLNRMGTLDLSTDIFEDTILENICWIRSLPVDTSMRQRLQSPYLQIDMDVRQVQKHLALMQVCGPWRKMDGVTEFLDASNGEKAFCFVMSQHTISLNVNPSQRSMKLRVCDVEEYIESAADFDAMKASQGGLSLWDRRFPVHEMPPFLSCGTIFGRHFGLRHKLGEEGCNITLGGFNFTREGFLSVGFGVEGVYFSQSHGEEIYLCESDVLCIRELSDDLQKELISSLSPQEAFPSIARILKAESDITNVRLTARTIGTTTADIERAIWKIKDEDVGANEVNIRRLRIDKCLYSIAIADNRFGRSVYTFQTTVVIEASLGDLLYFKTNGDINMTLSKVRLMMGSDEFSKYAKDGLSLGIGTYDGKEEYQSKLELEGSEFMLCHQCKAIYSPINMMMCVVSSNLRTRKIKARWGEMHKCSEGSEPCNIVGTAE